MSIKLLVNIVNGHTGENELPLSVDVFPNDSLGDVFLEVASHLEGSVVLDKRGLYLLDDPFYFQDSRILPFVKEAESVRWNAHVENTSIESFLDTHPRLGSQLNVIHYSLGGVGGGGFLQLLDISLVWEQALEILSITSGLWTIAGFPNAKDLILWIKEKFSRDTVRPSAVFSLVLSRRRWNPIELAEFIDVGKEEAKLLLRLCQYQYNRQDMMYVQTDKTRGVVQQLQSVEYWNKNMDDYDLRVG